MKKKLKLPKFKNEAAERAFWSKIDLSKYYEASDFENVVFPNLKPTSHPISLRLPDHILVRLKERSNELDMPYQTLMKQYIAEGLKHKV